MKAEVITEFKGAADGEIYPRVFKAGEIITGELAASEIAAGRAVEVCQQAKKPLESAAASLPASPPAPASRRKTAKKSEDLQP